MNEVTEVNEVGATVDHRMAIVATRIRTRWARVAGSRKAQLGLTGPRIITPPMMGAGFPRGRACREQPRAPRRGGKPCSRRGRVSPVTDSTKTCSGVKLHIGGTRISLGTPFATNRRHGTSGSIALAYPSATASRSGP